MVDALREVSHEGPLVLVCQGESPAAIVDAVAHFSVQGGHRFVLNLAPVIDVNVATLRTSDPLIVNESEAQSLLARFEASGAASLALALHAAPAFRRRHPGRAWSRRRRARWRFARSGVDADRLSGRLDRGR